ncbi:MAG: mevalonate kinase [Anaerolineae bacterium]|nr:mevalonate kinase [Anaerolineae bacterium]MCX8067985.1 mevalonate kinase [Anaerolineae bacterium]MDW7992563.1 mevalonate kinase [Anaerolineae bacterium]
MTGRICASAAGKVILLGEHAVVYGRPALAIPLQGLRAWATLTPHAGPFRIQAPAVGVDALLSDLPMEHPLARIVYLTAEHFGFAPPQALLRIDSEIPVASGLGSGAAVSTAVVRALAAWYGVEAPPEVVSALVYEVERIYHGTPSGIDNTVIAYGRPIYFVRGQPPRPLAVGGTFFLLIADSGIPSPTREVVLDVRRRWEADRERYEGLFDRIAEQVEAAHRAIVEGNAAELGARMNENHRLLQEMGVSAPVLDRLVDAARRAGALGAKLSGAGRGGNVVALVEADAAGCVAKGLKEAGARRVWQSTVHEKNT